MDSLPDSLLDSLQDSLPADSLLHHSLPESPVKTVGWFRCFDSSPAPSSLSGSLSVSTRAQSPTWSSRSRSSNPCLGSCGTGFTYPSAVRFCLHNVVLEWSVSLPARHVPCVWRRCEITRCFEERRFLHSKTLPSDHTPLDDTDVVLVCVHLSKKIEISLF